MANDILKRLNYDADAISHFDNIPSLLYLAYVKKGLDIEGGRIFVKEKLMRSYEKLSDNGKEFYRDKFQNVMQILEVDHATTSHQAGKEQDRYEVQSK